MNCLNSHVFLKFDTLTGNLRINFQIPDKIQKKFQVISVSSLSRIAFKRWLLNSDSELRHKLTNSSLDNLSRGDFPLEFLGEQFGGGGAGGRSTWSSHFGDFDRDWSLGGWLLSSDLEGSVSLIFLLVSEECFVVSPLIFKMK